MERVLGWFSYDEEDEEDADKAAIAAADEAREEDTAAAAATTANNKRQEKDAPPSPLPKGRSIDDLNVSAATIQRSFRGYLVRCRLYRVPVKSVEKELITLNRIERGFNMLCIYLIMMAVFAQASLIRVSSVFAGSMHCSLTALMEGITFQRELSEDQSASVLSYQDVNSLDDFKLWQESMVANLYVGTQLPHYCNNCHWYYSQKPYAVSCDPSSDFYWGETICSNTLYCIDGSCDGFDGRTQANGVESVRNYLDIYKDYDCQKYYGNMPLELGLTYNMAHLLTNESVNTSSQNGGGEITNHNFAKYVFLTIRNSEEGLCSVEDNRYMTGDCLTGKDVEDPLVFPPNPNHYWYAAAIEYTRELGFVGTVDMAGSYNLGFIMNLCMIRQWQDAGFLSNTTTEAGVGVVVYNGHDSGHYALVEVNFNFAAGGCVKRTLRVNVFQLAQSAGTRESAVMAMLQMSTFFFLMFFLILDIRSLRRLARRRAKNISISREKEKKVRAQAGKTGTRAQLTSVVCRSVRAAEKHFSQIHLNGMVDKSHYRVARDIGGSHSSHVSSASNSGSNIRHRSYNNNNDGREDIKYNKSNSSKHNSFNQCIGKSFMMDQHPSLHFAPPSLPPPPPPRVAALSNFTQDSEVQPLVDHELLSHAFFLGCWHISFYLVMFAWGLLDLAAETSLADRSPGTVQLDNAAFIADRYINIMDYVSLWDYYLLALLISSIFGLLRLLDILQFHRRLSVITATIWDAGWHLLHFGVIYCLVLAAFSFIATTLLGPLIPEFNTMSDSYVSFIRISLGDYESYYQMIVAADTYDRYFSGIGLVIIFQLTVGVLMLNILIAICITAFQNTQNYASAHDNLLDSIMFFVSRKCLRVRNYTIRRKNACVIWCRPRKDKEGGAWLDDAGSDGGSGGGGGIGMRPFQINYRETVLPRPPQRSVAGAAARGKGMMLSAAYGTTSTSLNETEEEPSLSPLHSSAAGADAVAGNHGENSKRNGIVQHSTRRKQSGTDSTDGNTSDHHHHHHHHHHYHQHTGLTQEEEEYRRGDDVHSMEAAAADRNTEIVMPSVPVNAQQSITSYRGSSSSSGSDGGGRGSSVSASRHASAPATLDRSNDDIDHGRADQKQSEQKRYRRRNRGRAIRRNAAPHKYQTSLQEVRAMIYGNLYQGTSRGKFIHLREVRRLLIDSPAPAGMVDRILAKLIFERTWGDVVQTVQTRNNSEQMHWSF